MCVCVCVRVCVCVFCSLHHMATRVFGSHAIAFTYVCVASAHINSNSVRDHTKVTDNWKGSYSGHRYWHQTIDGFEELRTWFDLLGTVTEIIRGSSSDGGTPDELQEMYASLVASNALQN